MKTENKVLEPFKFLNDINCMFVLVVLNHDDSPMKTPADRFNQLWNKAVFHACVDGGTNFVSKFNKKMPETDEKLIPNLISGDFDSVDAAILAEFQDLGTEVISTPDQDHTDFTKCLTILEQKFQNNDIPVKADIVVTVPECTNRFDHAMANINTLHNAREILSGGNKVFLLSQTTLQFVVFEGETTINLGSSLQCNSLLLLPMHKPAIVSTSGLEKDLNNDSLKFGSPFCTFQCVPSRATFKINTNNSLLVVLNMVA